MWTEILFAETLKTQRTQKCAVYSQFADLNFSKHENYDLNFSKHENYDSMINAILQKIVLIRVRQFDESQISLLIRKVSLDCFITKY